MEALQEPGTSPGCLAACFLAWLEEGREEGGGNHHKHHHSPVVVSAAPLPPTGAPLARLLLHTGGRAAPRRALSLRTRNPLSQSGVTQEGRELPVGGAKKEENDCRTTCFAPLPPPPPPALPPFYSALPPARHQPRGRTHQWSLFVFLFFSVFFSLSLFAAGELCASLRAR